MSLIYLASPYSAPTPAQREDRFIQVCQAAAQVMNWGYEVFCPIAHSHPIEIYGSLDRVDHDFWLQQDFAILKHCDELWVYQMDGWDRSNGVMAEVEFAFENEIPVFYLKRFRNGYRLAA